MRICCSHFIGVLALAWVLVSLGCATSERDAAKKLDMTPDIIQEASSLFAVDKELHRFPIKVDGFKGAMSLSGQVATEAQKNRSAQLLWAVRGVKSVENRLAVSGQSAK